MTTRVLATGILGLLLTTSLASVAVAQEDAPDLNQEAKFHRIYKQYNVQPTSADKWQSALGQTQSQSYDVQKGDTLWDISDTLFADSEFWPKVWSLNVEKIGNPHEIEVGQRIQFTPGTAGEPPQLAITDQKTEVGKDDAQNGVQKWMQDEKPIGIKFDLNKVTIPPPSHPPRPVTDIPASLPRWNYKSVSSDVVDMQLESPRRDFGHPPEILTAYIDDSEPMTVGKVTEIETDVDAAVEFQYIVVQLPEKIAENKLLVVKEVGKVKDPETGESGHVVHVQGEIQILGEVNPDRNLYRAMVTKSMDLVEVGSLLISGNIPVYDTSAKVAQSSADAVVIGGGGSTDRKIFGSHAIVYLNGGSGKGMVPGSVYPIYKKQSTRTKTNEIQNPLEIGHVKVLRVGNNFATAVITDAKEEVQVGDTTSPTLSR